MQDRWFLLGDIHGEAGPIKRFYEENRERLGLDQTRNHMILLGDVGVNFALRGQRDLRIKTELSRYPFTYLCLRGNHEARAELVRSKFPNEWEIRHKYEGEILVETAFPHIEYLLDYPAIYEFAGYKTLSLPGAYSIDKWYRLANDWPWFADEQLSEEEMERGRVLVQKAGAIDLVISHTAPMIYEPTDLFFSSVDQDSVDKTMERYLGEIEYSLDYKRWAFGHFHADRLYPWNNGKQVLMLFNERVVDLKKFMEMKSTDSLADIMA